MSSVGRGGSQRMDTAACRHADTLMSEWQNRQAGRRLAGCSLFAVPVFLCSCHSFKHKNKNSCTGFQCRFLHAASQLLARRCARPFAPAARPSAPAAQHTVRAAAELPQVRLAARGLASGAVGAAALPPAVAAATASIHCWRMTALGALAHSTSPPWRSTSKRCGL